MLFLITSSYFSNLTHNRLLSFDKNVGLSNNIIKLNLDLSFNPLHCSCDLIWMIEKMRINQMNVIAKCNEPMSLKNLPFTVAILPHLNSCKLIDQSIEVFPVPHNEIVIKNVIIGDHVILNCDSSNQNSSWYQNNRIIDFNNSKFHLYTNGSLGIKSIQLKDENFYTCGKNSRSYVYDVRVVGIKIRLIFIFNKFTDLILLEPPIFTTVPDQLYEFDVGSSFELVCDADAGDRKPIITWVNKSINRNLTTGNKIHFHNVTR